MWKKKGRSAGLTASETAAFASTAVCLLTVKGKCEDKSNEFQIKGGKENRLSSFFFFQIFFPFFLFLCSAAQVDNAEVASRAEWFDMQITSFVVRRGICLCKEPSNVHYGTLWTPTFLLMSKIVLCAPQRLWHEPKRRCSRKLDILLCFLHFAHLSMYSECLDEEFFFFPRKYLCVQTKEEKTILWIVWSMQRSPVDRHNFEALSSELWKKRCCFCVWPAWLWPTSRALSFLWLGDTPLVNFFELWGKSVEQILINTFYFFKSVFWAHGRLKGILFECTKSVPWPPSLYSNSSSAADSRSYWKCFLVNVPFISQRTLWVCCTGRVGVEEAARYTLLYIRIFYFSLWYFFFIFGVYFFSPQTASCSERLCQVLLSHCFTLASFGLSIDRLLDHVARLWIANKTVCCNLVVALLFVSLIPWLTFDEFSAVLIVWCLCQIWCVLSVQSSVRLLQVCC